MDEIVTKSNLDSFTQGLKGVLGSMGLEINSKAGNTAISALEDKIDIIDLNVDDIEADTTTLKADTTILKSDTATLKSDTTTLKSDTNTLKTTTNTISGKCDDILTAVNSSSSDIDFSLFVTKDWLKEYMSYMLNPRIHINTPYEVYCYYFDYYGSRLYTTEYFSNGILVYGGGSLYNDLDKLYIYKYTVDDSNYNYENIVLTYFYMNEQLDITGINSGDGDPIRQGEYYGYECAYGDGVGLVDDSDHDCKYPIKKCNGSLTLYPNNIFVGFRVLLIITLEDVSNPTIKIKYGDRAIGNGNYIFTPSYSDNYSDLFNIPEIEGYDYTKCWYNNYFTITYYKNTKNIYQGTLYHNSYYLSDLKSTLYSYSSDLRTSPPVIDVILRNTHAYGGTYNSSTGKMTLKQILDNDLSKYIDGTSVTNDLNTYIFVKFPEFYVKNSSTSCLFYIDLTKLTTPSGSGWVKLGNKFIGKYACKNNSAFTSYNSTPTSSITIANWITLRNNAPTGFNFVGIEEYFIMSLFYVWLGSGGLASKAKISHYNYSSNVIFDLYLTKKSSYYKYNGLISNTTNMPVANSSNKTVNVTSSNILSYNNLLYLPYTGTASTNGGVSVRNYGSSTFYYQYIGLDWGMRYDYFYLSDTSQTAYERITYSGPYEIVS